MPHGLRPSADGSIVVIANTTEGALDVIDPATDTVLGSVPVGANPAQVAVTADGRFAYAGITDPSAVVKVDLDAYTVVAAAPVPSDPVQVYLTPDEATVISADQGTRDEPGSTASSIDTATMTVRSTATTGSGPHGVVVDTAGTRAWATASTTHQDVTVPPQPSARPEMAAR
ncbi:YncE family protein [Mycolicibacterium fallax]|uniref:YncE family protein n=1 Tax=Mycolicibacterium fallax TaxID=1793 RepID=UPI0015D3D62B|nr:YncE family protein [Mycolicibacterium fallax]